MKVQGVGLKHYNNPKAFIEYPNLCRIFIKILYNPGKKTKSINSL